MSVNKLLADSHEFYSNVITRTHRTGRQDHGVLGFFSFLHGEILFIPAKEGEEQM